MLKRISSLLLMVGMASCTYNVTNSMAHTEGTATDVVDDTMSTSTTPKVDVTSNVPVNSPNSSQNVTLPPTGPIAPVAPAVK